MPRLRRADCSGPGITRRRSGRGFAFYDDDGERVDEPEVLQRIGELGIPPAWKDVWICPYPNGHLQATGVDAAGRKQYRYHDAWRTRRDAEKFEAMTRFAKALPGLREQVEADLAATDELTRDRVLACAVRLLDRGFFRIGTEEYTVTNESFGLATMRKEHVQIEDGQMVFDYPAKSGKRRIQAVVDPLALEIVSKLKRRRGGGDELLAFRAGRRWVDVRSDDINAYLKQATGDDFSAKDFRTWSATVIAVAGAGRLRPGARQQDLAQTRDHARDPGDLALPGQHARRVPRVLHRPARVRRLPRRARARPEGHHRGARRRARRPPDPPPADRAGRAGPDRRARDRARRRHDRRLMRIVGGRRDVRAVGLRRRRVVRPRGLAVGRRVGGHRRLLGDGRRDRLGGDGRGGRFRGLGDLEHGVHCGTCIPEP